MFGLKQGWACLFGIAMLIYAIGLQVAFVMLRLESWKEVRVIALFHLTGTAMELFKVNVGSWAYPEPGLMKIAGVPLFSGFMYAAVGSYMARVIRIFDMVFAPYPPFWTSVALAIGIYVNFFSHTYLPDIRIGLFIATVVLFGRTRVWFDIGQSSYWMPLPLAALLSSFFLWLAENVGTNTGTWVYASHAGFEWVSWSKMGSWYLLLYVSFVTVTLVYRDALSPGPVTRYRARSESRSTAQTSGSD